MKLASINENLNSDIKKLKKHDYNIADTLTHGPYTILLIHHTPTNKYQIALTSNNQEFVTTQSQIKKPQQTTGIQIQTLKKITNKLKEWLNNHGDLSAGSYNQTRTHKYHKLLTKLNFKTSQIEHNKTRGQGQHTIPESWSFTIHK